MNDPTTVIGWSQDEHGPQDDRWPADPAVASLFIELEENAVSRCMLAVVTMLVAGAAAAMMDDIRTYAYVTNEGSGTVSVIDVATHRVTGTMKVGDRPRGIAASPDGSRLYISDQGGRLIERDIFMSMESGSVMLAHSPDAVHFDLDGKLLAVALEESNSIALVDPAYMKVVKTIAMHGKNPEHAVFSPNGRWIYASAEEGDSVDVIDVAKGEVVKVIEVGARPRGIGFLPDSSRAYVAAENANQVAVIDVARQEVVARIEAASRANGITVHPDGKRVFVSAGGAGVVQVLDTTTNRVVAEAEVGQRPWNMALTPDGKQLYVACGGSNEVSVIDTTTYKSVARIPVGTRPWGVVIRPRPDLPAEPVEQGARPRRGQASD